MRLGRPALLCLSLAACQGVTLLPAPPSAGGQSLLLIVLRQETVVRVEALAAGDSLPALSELSDSAAAATVVALEYRCPLDVLGLAPGTQVLLDEPRARAELPEPLSRAAITPSRERAWQPAGPELSERTIRRLPIEPGRLCAGFGARMSLRPISVAAAQDNIFLFDEATLRDGRALFSGAILDRGVGATPGRFYLVSPDGTVEVSTPLTASSATIAAGALYVDPDDEIWVFGQLQTLAHGRLGGAFQRLMPTFPLEEDTYLNWLSTTGPLSGSAREMYAAYTHSMHATLYRFGPDGQPSRLYVAQGLGYPSLLWLSQSELLMAGSSLDATGVLHMRPTGTGSVSFSTEPLPSGLPEWSDTVETPTAIAGTASFGPIVAATFMKSIAPKGGALHRRVGGSWRRLKNSVVPNIYAATVRDAGHDLVVFGGADQDELVARLFVYDLVAGAVCQEITLPRDNDIPRRLLHFSPLGPEQLLLVSAARASEGQILRTDRQSPAPCLLEDRPGE